MREALLLLLLLLEILMPPSSSPNLLLLLLLMLVPGDASCLPCVSRFLASLSLSGSRWLRRSLARSFRMGPPSASRSPPSAMACERRCARPAAPSDEFRRLGMIFLSLTNVFIRFDVCT